jgi:hypothetical protein
MPAKKSASEEFKENMFYFVIIVGVYYVLVGIWKIITAPFRALLVSNETKLDRAIEIAKEKKKAREEIRRRYKNDPNNMLEQCVKRFNNPEVWAWDDNASMYRQWYKQWRDGELLDTTLLWAPDVYRVDFNKKNVINSEFLDYFSKQVTLHMKNTHLARHNFLRTVRNYYPEFTPKFSLFYAEIKELREHAKSADLKERLVEVIVQKGLPKDIAIELIRRNEDDPETLKKEIVQMKKNLEYHCKYYENTLWFFLDNDYDPEGPLAETYNLILNQIGSEEIAKSLIKGRITVDELNDCVQDAVKVYPDYATNDTHTERWRDCIICNYKTFMRNRITDEVPSEAPLSSEEIIRRYFFK